MNALTIPIYAYQCRERETRTWENLEMSGYFATAFEESSFKPCLGLPGPTHHHPAAPNDAAWVEFSPKMRKPFPWPSAIGALFRREVYVRWRGSLTGPGKYGHLGGSPYLFVVDSVLEARDPSAEDCADTPMVNAKLLAELERKVAPMVQLLDSMEADLRLRAGTPSADSTVRAWYKPLALRLDTVQRTFLDSAFTVAIYPNGALAQQTYRFQSRAGFDADSTDRGLADSLVQFLSRRGVWILRAEGDPYVELSDQEILRRAERHVTPPFAEFLRFRAEEEASPSMGDASVMISWDELGRRAATREAWAQRNPGYPEHGAMSQLSRRYVRVFIRGSDNTRVFDHGRKVMPAKYRDAYRRYVAAHPDTESGRIVAEYLRALEADRWREGANVRAFIAKHDAILSWRH